MAIHYTGSPNHHTSDIDGNSLYRLILKITKFCFEENYILSLKSMGLDLSKQKKFNSCSFLRLGYEKKNPP